MEEEFETETDMILEQDEQEEQVAQDEFHPVEMQTCSLCGIRQPEELIHKLYCQKCSENLQQAYKWLQSPLLPEAEIQALKQQMYDMTDIQNINFD